MAGRRPRRAGSLSPATCARPGRTCRIALALPSGIAFIERTLAGILDYTKRRGGWVFVRMPERLSPSIAWLRQWPGDGAFVLITTPAGAATAQ